MFAVAWLVVVYWSESASTDSARCIHCFESGAMLTAEVAVLIPGVDFSSHRSVLFFRLIWAASTDATLAELFGLILGGTTEVMKVTN